jgi:hypothetical protein
MPRLEEREMTATLPRDKERLSSEDVSASVEVLSRGELEALLEREARKLTGKSFHEASAMLYRGELNGAAAAGALRTLRHLLRAA